MSKRYAIGDMHLGHKNICKFREGFETVEEHDEFVLDRYRSIITKRDIVVFTGDIIFDRKYLQIVKDLPGDKILVAGNHCTERGIKMRDLIEVFGRVFASYSKGGLLYSHMPIHPQELRGKPCVHGHVHDFTLPDVRYFNTSLEAINYTPIDVQVIKQTIKERFDALGYKWPESRD